MPNEIITRSGKVAGVQRKPAFQNRVDLVDLIVMKALNIHTKFFNFVVNKKNKLGCSLYRSDLVI